MVQVRAFFVLICACVYLRLSQKQQVFFTVSQVVEIIEHFRILKLLVLSRI